MFKPVLFAAVGLMLLQCACGGGGGAGLLLPPTKAPSLAGEVAKRGGSALRGVSADDLVVRVVVSNPNAPGTDVEVIRYCLKHDSQEDSPLTQAEAKGYLDPVPPSLPPNVDVQQTPYTGSPQVIAISSFLGGALSPDDRYWISAVFVSGAGVAGPVTLPQRFKLIFRYQLVEPPAIGILKTFEGTVYDEHGQGLPNAFVQYFHKGKFLEAAVTEDSGHYYFEVVVPNPTTPSSVRAASCEESPDETEYVLKAYHPDYDFEPRKYLLPEYVHYYVDLFFSKEHNEGGGGDI